MHINKCPYAYSQIRKRYFLITYVYDARTTLFIFTFNIFNLRIIYFFIYKMALILGTL